MTDTRNFEADLLRRRSATQDKQIADAIDGDVSFISRFFSGERGLRINQIEPVLRVIGLKVVPAETQLISNDELEALRVLARKALGAGSGGA